jgi:hypothetical protein
MPERFNAPVGSESPEVAAKAEAWLLNQKSTAWENGVTDDFTNIVGGVSINVGNSSSWSKIQPVTSVEEFVRTHPRFSDDPKRLEIAKAIIRRIDQDFLVRANDILNEINETIAEGITDPEQVDILKSQCQVFFDLFLKRPK